MVKITEPMTMITDYILSIMSFLLGIALIATGSDKDQLSMILWGIGLITTGISALLGGTYHGFTENISEESYNLLRKLTLYSIGLTSLFILMGSIISSIRSETIQYILIGVGIIGFIIYGVWIKEHIEFIYAIMNYVPTMLVIIFLKIYSYFEYDDPSSLWIISGILIAFIGAGIQASGFSLHKHMNNNDIFHIIQMISTYFLYLGALEFTDF